MFANFHLLGHDHLLRSAIVSLLCILAIMRVGAAEFHVTPDGKGDGSKDAPWNLQTALDATQLVKPGDTIWLHGGTYQGGFTCRLNGTADAPVTVRAMPGERVTIDCKPRDEKDSGIFTIDGDWTVLWGIEFTCSDPKRRTETTGSWPADLKRGGVYTRGSNAKLINLVIHDTGGVGFWGDETKGEGGEAYGCIVYYNGWSAPDRGHGHAIYAQNAKGTKRIEDNILFCQFSDGLHCYGSAKAKLNGFHVEGNVSFNNGALVKPDNRTIGIFLGGSTPLENAVITKNYTYGGNGLKLGYASNVMGTGVVATDNYLGGNVQTIRIHHLQFTGNTIIAPGTLAQVEHPPIKGGSTKWDANRYFRTKVEYAAFLLKTSSDTNAKAVAFAEWLTRTVFDEGSTYLEQRPTENLVVVRPNRYEPGRAHVVVYNWKLDDTVEVDLSPVLKPGQEFALVSAQDFYGKPWHEASYDGRPFRLSMKRARKPVAPVGMPDYAVPVTEPEFGVYVVLPK